MLLGVTWPVALPSSSIAAPGGSLSRVRSTVIGAGMIEGGGGGGGGGLKYLGPNPTPASATTRARPIHSPAPELGSAGLGFEEIGRLAAARGSGGFSEGGGLKRFSRASRSGT